MSLWRAPGWHEAALLWLIALACPVFGYDSFYIPDKFAHPYYQVRFFESLPEQIAPEAKLVPMKLHKVDYMCIMPAENSSAVAEPLTELTNDLAVDEARQIIQNLNSDIHYISGAEWWGYGLSQGSKLTQFHANIKDNVVYIPSDEEGTYNLGAYTHGPIEPVLIGEQFHMRVEYDDGQFCMLTGVPRKADIYYFCDTSSTSDSEIIYSATETLTCVYEVFVGTPKLCHLPEFQPPNVPTNYIDCAEKDRKAPVAEQEASEQEVSEQEVSEQEVFEQEARESEQVSEQVSEQEQASEQNSPEDESEHESESESYNSEPIPVDQIEHIAEPEQVLEHETVEEQHVPESDFSATTEQEHPDPYVEEASEQEVLANGQNDDSQPEFEDSIPHVSDHDIHDEL